MRGGRFRVGVGIVSVSLRVRVLERVKARFKDRVIITFIVQLRVRISLIRFIMRLRVIVSLRVTGRVSVEVLVRVKLHISIGLVSGRRSDKGQGMDQVYYKVISDDLRQVSFRVKVRVWVRVNTNVIFLVTVRVRMRMGVTVRIRVRMRDMVGGRVSIRRIGGR